MPRILSLAILFAYLIACSVESRAEVAPLWSTVKLADGTPLPVLKRFKRMTIPGRASLVAVQIERRKLKGDLPQKTSPIFHLVSGDVIADVTKVYAGDDDLISREATIRVVCGGMKVASPPFQSDSIPSAGARGVWLVIEHRGELRGTRCIVANASFPVYDRTEIPSSFGIGIEDWGEIEAFANQIEAAKNDGLPTADHILSLASSENRCIAHWAAGLATSGAVELSEDQLIELCASDDANVLAQSQIDDALISNPSTAKGWQTHEVRKAMYRRWLKLKGDAFRDLVRYYLRPCFEDWDARGFGRKSLNRMVSEALGHHPRAFVEWRVLHQMFPEVSPPSATVILPAE